MKILLKGDCMEVTNEIIKVPVPVVEEKTMVAPEKNIQQPDAAEISKQENYYYHALFQEYYNDVMSGRMTAWQLTCEIIATSWVYNHARYSYERTLNSWSKNRAKKALRLEKLSQKAAEAKRTVAVLEAVREAYKENYRENPVLITDDSGDKKSIIQKRQKMLADLEVSMQHFGSYTCCCKI